MKKYILILFITLSNILFLNATNVQTETIINNKLSEVIVNMPATIKIFESEDNHIHFRLRSKPTNVLNEIYYIYDNNTLQFNSNKSLNYMSSDNIVIYLYVPNDNIKYKTKNNDLFVNTIKLNNSYKNISKSNHENNN
jgi:REP element-mobilizing transposase RayT